MKKTTKFLIIVSIIGVSLFLGLYGQKDRKVSSLAMGSALESTADSTTTQKSSVGNEIQAEISFISTLSSIKSLKIDPSLFSDVLFSRLKDNSVKIEPVVPGPINGKQSQSASSSKVTTTSPTQITNNSAVFNGQVNVGGNDDISDIYFEYGPTEGLGKTTTSISQTSLVGTFVKEVTGLYPRTAYFFRACARINRVVSCGDIVSFTTN
jgi:hypothetical protein